jgi:ethanolamine utilization protein EutP
MRDYEDMTDKPKILVIGGIGAGKSTLIAKLNGTCEEIRKTQALIYNNHTIDTPGEYLENPMMYKNIIATAEGVDFILIVQDAHQSRNVYPPGMARSFNSKVIGVITKADGELDKLRNVLEDFKEIGVEEPYFITSAKTGVGLDDLKNHIYGKFEQKKQEV